MFIIEDAFHAEWQDGHFTTFDDALAELKRRAIIPWNEGSNRCPCTQWRTCSRHYEIVELDTSTQPWKELRRERVLEISSGGIVWIAPHRMDY